MSSLDQARLQRMRDVLTDYVTRGEMPGMVALLSRGDHTHVEAIGTTVFGGAQPMTEGTVFRIASLTKLVVAVAAMQLVEACVLRLEDPISQWLPELGGRRVLRSLEAELDDTVPAQREITVRDLLTYRMGFGSIMAPPGSYPIQRAVRELRIGGDGFWKPTEVPETEVWLRNLASLPLMAQPGAEWMYHVSGDVLGVLLARVSGLSLGVLLRERIFAPLGMESTGFSVTREAAPQLAAVYGRKGEEGKPTLFDDPAASAWVGAPPFESGGGGLLSSVRDYLVFCRMLLHGGVSQGRRLLASSSVSLMASDQVPASARSNAAIFFGEHSSWGLGFAVDIARREIYHSPGRFGWTGGLGTTAYIDPANDVVGILFTQRMMDSPQHRIFEDFWNSAYACW